MIAKSLVQAFAVMASLAVPPAFADSLRGTVVDPQDLPVPGALLVIQCPGHRQSMRSDASGRFVFEAIPTPGCSLSVKHPGFKPFEEQLDSGVRVRPVRLELAGLNSSVDVAADQSQPLLERRVNSASLSAAELQSVSNTTEDWVRYAKLVAGVNLDSDAIYVDGLPTATLPPSAAVERITVNADPFSAEYSDGDSTHIDIITKGGNRSFGLNFGGLSFGAGGHNVLDPKLKSESRSGQADFNGFIPHIPVTFAGHINGGEKSDEQPILAIMPAPGNPNGSNLQNASTESVSFSGAIDTFYTGESIRAHLSVSDTHNQGSNQGVGGITLPEAGIASRSNSVEARATINTVWNKVAIAGGIVVSERYSRTNANSTDAGVTVPGAFVAGGAPMTDSSSSGTLWTVKGVLQPSGALPASWTAGLTISGERVSKLSIPDANGAFTFPNLAAYEAALDGAGTGTWVLTHGNGAASYSGISAAPFIQKPVLRSQHFLITVGLRADYQSNFKLMWSPRASGAFEWHGFVFRAGGGLFARNIPLSVLLKSISNDRSHLEESLLTNVSLLEDLADIPTTGDALIHSQLASDMVRPRELMAKFSAERRFGKFSLGTEDTWTHGRHLLGSRRLPDGSGWVDVLESDRSSDRQRIHSQIRYTWRKQSLSAHYEWIHSRDDTSGAFSFPANQDDLRGEWARSAGISPHNFNLVGNLKLPRGVTLIATDTWRSSAPYNITTGLDPANDGLYTDRGGLARNSGDRPAYNSLSLYGRARIPIPRVTVRKKPIAAVLGIRAENILGNKNYTSLGSIVGSPTFGQPLTATPGRALRFWLNLE